MYFYECVLWVLLLPIMEDPYIDPHFPIPFGLTKSQCSILDVNLRKFWPFTNTSRYILANRPPQHFYIPKTITTGSCAKSTQYS